MASHSYQTLQAIPAPGLEFDSVDIKLYNVNASELIKNLRHFIQPTPVTHGQNILFDVVLDHGNNAEPVHLVTSSLLGPQASIPNLTLYLFLWIWTNRRAQSPGIQSGFVAGDVLLRDLGSFSMQSGIDLASYGISLETSIDRLYRSCVELLKRFQHEGFARHNVRRHAELRLNMYIGKGTTMSLRREGEKVQLQSWRPKQENVEIVFSRYDTSDTINVLLAWSQVCQPTDLIEVDFPPLMDNDRDIGPDSIEKGGGNFNKSIVEEMFRTGRVARSRKNAENLDYAKTMDPGSDAEILGDQF